MGQKNEPSKAAWKEGVRWVLNLRGEPLSPKTLYRIPILRSPMQEADAFTQILAPLPTSPLEAPAGDFMLTLQTPYWLRSRGRKAAFFMSQYPYVGKALSNPTQPLQSRG